MESALPTHCETVIVGGGITGCSVAYHLAKHGCTDVLLLERDTLTSGTTWHAAGAVASLRASALLTRLTAEAAPLFSTLEAETGQATGYRRTGGLSIAQTRERLEELKRLPAIGELTGLEVELVGPSEIKARSPVLNVDDLLGGVWIPWDGQTNPTDTTLALARGARQRGARIIEHVQVERIELVHGRVCGVATDRGPIACERVALCTGMWTRHLARRHGVAVPLQAVEHMYVVSEPVDGVPADQPFIRDFDAGIYIKGDAGRLLVGSIDPIAKPWAVKAIPEHSSFTLLPEDWDHFEPFMRAALNRIPALEAVGIRQFLNGPESFTVDSRHIIGAAPGRQGLFVAAGFNTTGIMSSAGVGKVLAEWMMAGEPPWDVWDIDVARFEGWEAGNRFIRDRTRESAGIAFAMHWPYRQPTTGRGVKVSALHERLEKAGACFGVVAGWERPLWYAPGQVRPEPEYGFGAQAWWHHAEAEARATQEAVALYDQSQLAVLELRGKDSESVLQYLCANDVGIDPGRVVYTQMLNERGGIEADVGVTRLGPERFWVTTGAAVRARDYHWIEAGVAASEHCSLCDLTSSLAVLSLMGPKSRDLLCSLTKDRLDADHFPFATVRPVEIANALVLAQRLSYVGELGFELYMPSEFARSVYDAVVAAGQAFGLAHAGLFCMDACRLEKGFKHWGQELSPSITPIEAGLGFAVCYDKPFRGREALLSKRGKVPTKRLVLLTVTEGEPLLLHDEPVYRDGERIGVTTSGNRAFRLGGSICFALIEHPDGCSRELVLSGSYEIRVGDRRFPAVAHWRDPYDPAGLRMRS